MPIEGAGGVSPSSWRRPPIAVNVAPPLAHRPSVCDRVLASPGSHALACFSATLAEEWYRDGREVGCSPGASARGLRRRDPARACAGGLHVGLVTPATSVSDTGATLNGSVLSAVDGTVSYWFVYGRTTGYGSETPHRTIAISDRTGTRSPSRSAGWPPAPPTTTRCARSFGGPGRSCGGDEMFTTTGARRSSRSRRSRRFFPTSTPRSATM